MDLPCIQLEGPLDGNRLFKCKFRGKGPFALKKIESTAKDWKSLVGLRNENVVCYHHCDVRDSISYLVMDLCWASMLDFCLGRLLDVSDVEIGRMMAETAHGLHFLHQSNIVHGRLGLDQVLLWRKRPNLKPIAKISGYYPHQNQPRIEDDLEALGRIFYSMAANDVNPPKKLPVSSRQLSLISFNQRTSASEMINLLLMDSSDSKPTSVEALLLGQSFFQTSSSARDRLRDVKELDDFKKFVEEDFKDDDINGLKEMITESLATDEDIGEFVSKAFHKYPELFALFIWDLSSFPPLEKAKFVERPPPSKLGGGSAGMVLAGRWIRENGEESPVACKRFYRHNNGNEKFYKEYKTLRQLDHLFVIKYFGACEIEFDMCILVELCEGTLQNYILGELKSIPKNSLDDRNILGQVTLGLAYIHSKEIIHKDLKPSNILLWRSSVIKTLVLVKLADFDFAKQSKTSRGDFSATFRPGTEGYMAPELLKGMSQNKGQQMRKVLATVHSDAYSLGITIGFTVLKGQHPFGNQQMIRGRVMESGAEPVLLGNLDWDVTDLILRLTRENPEERPNISLLIYHPYFVLANEKSRAHFADKIDDYFNLFQSPYEARMTYVNEVKIQEWMQIITSQTERETNPDVKKWLEQMSEFMSQETRLHLDNSKGYYEKIKKEIQRDNENDINKRFYNDTSKSKSMMDYFRDWPLWTRKLIQSGPRFSVLYFWCLLNDRNEDSPTPTRPHVSIQIMNNYLREKNKVQMPDMFRVADILKIEEHVHACLHLKSQEEIEDVWNHKRAGLLAAGIISDGQIHRWLRELPCYATPPSIIKNLVHRMENINSYHEDKTTVLHWVLTNRWEKIDVSIVVELLRRKANPNMGDKQGTTPVHYAAKNESSEGPTILKFLLENGGDPNQANGPKRKRTPLHYAAMNESSYAPSIVNILLAFDANVKVNVLDWHGFTPLHYAARSTSSEAPDILKSLVKSGGDPNKTLSRNTIEPPFRRTPVHIATLNESESGMKMLKTLLRNGGNPGNPNLFDCYRETSVHLAAKSESNFGPDIMKTLLENKGNLNLATHMSKLPIHFAAENTSSSGPSIMEIILKCDGDPNIAWHDGGTAVHTTVLNESEAGMQMLQLLLDHNGDPNNKACRARISPVHLAAASKFRNGPNVLKLLLEKGGKANALDGDGRTPVHSSAKNDSEFGPDLLKILIEKGGKVDVFDTQKITPTHLAAANSSDSGPSILKILLENGANQNTADENQETPVHYAAKNKSSSAPSILKILLENGGNFNVFNRSNESPFDLSVMNTSDSSPRLLEIFLEKGFSPNVANSEGVTSVHLAAANGSKSGPRLLTRLLENGGDCNAVDGKNKRPIHYAAENRSYIATEIVKILLDQDCDPNAIFTSGVTPVHLAIQNSSGLGILELLHKRGAILDFCDESGRTPVHRAAEFLLNPSIMEYLLDNGGERYVNAVDVCGENFAKYSMGDTDWRFRELDLSPDRKRKRTPVHYAAENESSGFHPEVLELLLKRGGNPNFEDERKRTPVHLAVRNRGMKNWRVLKILLKNKGNPNAVDDQLMTPVHFAVMLPHEKIKMMKLLMKHGGDPNAVDCSGRTPLHYAAMNEFIGAPQIIELLLANNGDPNVVDNSGLNPAHCCRVKNPSGKVAERILETLMKFGGNSDAADREG